MVACDLRDNQPWMLLPVAPAPHELPAEWHCLAGFSGYLRADTCAGYEKLTADKAREPFEIRHVARMAHARRHFCDAFEESKSPIAEEALRRIQEL